LKLAPRKNFLAEFQGKHRSPGAVLWFLDWHMDQWVVAEEFRTLK
jgi:hypothetical protein